MLTKEECLKAHEELSGMLVATDYLDGRAVCTYPIMEDELGLFYKLIEEHFDPQPYKFEDLKPNMWVWDDKYKSYLKIIGFDKIKGLDLSIYVSSGVGIYKHDFYIEFKENCLYPVTKVMQ